MFLRLFNKLGYWFVRNGVFLFFTFLGLGILASVVYFYYKFFNHLPISSDNALWGNFGSYVGGLAGALLSFITVVLLAYTLKRQIDSNRLSQFENSFFELFKMFKSTSTQISGEVEPSSNSGKWAPSEYTVKEYFDALKNYLQNEFDGLVNQLVKETDRKLDKTGQSEKEILQTQVDEVYDKLYKSKESELGHYFRSLYHLLKFIDESKINNRSKYFDIIQAFLSDSELYVIFYNGIGRHGREKLLPIMDKYSFLENIHPKGKEFNLHMKVFYPITFRNYSQKPIHQKN